mmetsp:Transcript_6078/g.11918  ORF Transcript_6078/g.11918 Transcript_6078/m.11918 type:complete len:87 (+) Transcript_6078:160-420(+)
MPSPPPLVKSSDQNTPPTWTPSNQAGGLQKRYRSNTPSPPSQAKSPAVGTQLSSQKIIWVHPHDSFRVIIIIFVLIVVVVKATQLV